MQADLVVIGAGLAGSCLAAAVAQRGWRVVLLERQRGPRHKVCGEFLSPEAQASLHALDLHATVAALAPAEIYRAAIISRQGQRLDMALPGVAWGVSRFRLDAALAQAAAEAGATVREGIAGMALTPCEGGYEVEMRDGAAERTSISTRTVVVACGRHAVPGLRPPQTATASRQMYVGVKCHYAGLQLPPEVRLYLFEGGYVGLSPIEDGQANLCLLASEEAFARVGRRVPAMLDAVAHAIPALARDLAGGQRLDESMVAVGAVDTTRPTVLWDQCARIGDAATMIPPLSGDGQAMAIHAAEICAPLIDDVLAGRRSLATWQTIYAAAWHAAYDQPLRTARWLQALLGQPQISAGLIGLGTLLPNLAQRLVLATRGPQRIMGSMHTQLSTEQPS
ncbi:MAG: NAD(P)-binding protein [Chloroflexales bacterium]|nr:NAD(P)-binding protein [Chloroflexales bacterium]